MKSAYACSLICFVLGFSGAAYSQSNESSKQYPPASIPERGGMLGFEFEQNPHVWHDSRYFKVSTVLSASPLYGYLHPGDWIYRVNGFDLRTKDDVIAIIHSGSPGSPISLDYLDSTAGQRALRVTTKLRGVQDFNDEDSGTSAPTNTNAPAPNNADAPFCFQDGEKFAGCAAIAFGGIYVLHKLFAGSDSSGTTESHSWSSGGGFGGGSSSSNEPYSPPPQYNQPPQSTPPPQDTSVGCAWGDTKYGTCH